MNVTHTPGAAKRFGRTHWRFQQTFATPLENLDLFVATILSAQSGVEQGTVTIDAIVFEPKELMALISPNPLSAGIGRDWTISATGGQAVYELLRATLAGWIDFWFVPTPKPFVIYADHDEYTTFFANTKSNLNKVVHALSEKGFEQIPDFQRNV